MMTKRYITLFFVCFFLFGALSAKKQNTMLVDSLSMERNENFISVKFLLHLDAVKVKSNRGGSPIIVSIQINSTSASYSESCSGMTINYSVIDK